MNAFETGYVPQGWKRGDTLVITLSAPPTFLRKGLRGRIMQHIAAVPLKNAASSVAAVDFEHQDWPRVKLWLEWWAQASKLRTLSAALQKAEAVLAQLKEKS